MEFHKIKIGELERDLPIVPVSSTVKVALFNMLGDAEVTEVAGKMLAAKMPKVDVLIVPEVKALSLAHVISRETNIPYVVVRKTIKPYMTNPVVNKVISITTGEPQNLVVDGFDIDKIKNKKIAIVDDVVSSGGTLNSLKNIIEEIRGECVCVLAVLTEGQERKDVIALGHLPIFTN